MADLRRQAPQREALRLEPILRKNFDIYLGPRTKAALVAAVERALSSAIRTGISDRRAVTAFVILALLIGEGFHEQPDVARILACGSARTAELAVVALLAELQWQLSTQPEARMPLPLVIPAAIGAYEALVALGGAIAAVAAVLGVREGGKKLTEAIHNAQAEADDDAVSKAAPVSLTTQCRLGNP